MSSKISEISHSTITTGKAADKINENVKQTVADLSDVASRITDVNHDTSDAVAGVAEISRNITEFRHLSHNLQTIVTQFKY